MGKNEGHDATRTGMVEASGPGLNSMYCSSKMRRSRGERVGLMAEVGTTSSGAPVHADTHTAGLTVRGWLGEAKAERSLQGQMDK